MTKRNIALVAGGDSGEFVISIKSAGMIRDNLDRDLFNVYTVLICKNKWVCIVDDGREMPVDKNDFSVLLSADRKLCFDCVFITIHGTPGEDGKLQAYFELLGIPYTTSGVLASALTFNKYFCGRVVHSMGYAVPVSIKLQRNNGYASVEVLSQIKLPVFVKPVEGGSSLGMSFVRDRELLMPAIQLAFGHDNAVLVEEYLEGVELTCGVFRYNRIIKALPVTEIISKTAAGYFDFDAKYTPGSADEITPARISPELTREVQKVAAELYQKLDLSGLVRFDFIHCRNTLYFIEVNITPGMTETSLVPQAAAIEGISNRELFTMLIMEAINCP